MDLSYQVKKIISADDSQLAIHYWLEGFDKLINNAFLDTALINQYIEYSIQNHKPFTQLVSGSFYKKHFDSINDNNIRVINLPVDNDSHLQFPLVLENFMEQIMYTECGPYCRVLAPYKFPDIELRRSMDFSGDKNSLDSITNGTFYFDPTMSVIGLHPDDIMQTYGALKEFISYTKIIK